MRALTAAVAVGAAALAAVAGGLVLTRPETVPSDRIAAITPDLARGEWVYHAAGCASCHAQPDGDRDILSGGLRLASPVGTFVVPNISSDPTAGVGGWTDADLVSAIMLGTGRDGAHLYPSFPYAAYRKASLDDVVSLVAHLRTLPADPTVQPDHDLSFPFNIRLGIGAWKLLHLSDDYAVSVDGTAAQRGQYVAEALGHCGECHTPRDLSQGLDASRWMAGAPDPTGRGRIPNVTPGGLDWSEEEIASYLTSGFTPEFDVASGHMAKVIEGLRQLPADVGADLAAYLEALPPLPSEAGD